LGITGANPVHELSVLRNSIADIKEDKVAGLENGMTVGGFVITKRVAQRV
jgi:hypothetical protein